MQYMKCLEVYFRQWTYRLHNLGITCSVYSFSPLHQKPDIFRHFMKCLISRTACNIYIMVVLKVEAVSKRGIVMQSSCTHCRAQSLLCREEQRGGRRRKRQLRRQQRRTKSNCSEMSVSTAWKVGFILSWGWRAQTKTDRQTHTHTRTHACTQHARTHAHTHTHTHARTHARTHASSHSRADTPKAI